MLDANQHPVNLSVKDHLTQLGLSPHPDQLYLHQLMMQFLVEGNHGLANREQARQLREKLVELDLDDPESLMSWMSVDETLDPEELKELSPEEAAQVALQVLHLETAAKDATYP